MGQDFGSLGHQQDVVKRVGLADGFFHRNSIS
jgi:hypothetical protein